ncbi:cytochrome b subunit of formate dehydrogenase [Brevundimonas nasdae]|uniref:DUF4112 domain-containing protein n=1 Tax=Brevundimonas nasdae TaxID=172043 RepID=UPI0019146715|nr:DUF4112 domain-containing protein [Brevundimonas nasdae]MBK6025058.1 DUF4112 domain-containing protein [Brevundimonas nasdae]MDQ0451608.1 cytochrome b subunit of formate dehydrogenase [Brevundimonas nasdae]
MAKCTIRDIENIWSNVEGIKKLSDRVIGFGPFGVGMDGLLTWVPIVGTVYTVGTGGWLMWQGLRAKATPATLARMAAYMAVDAATGTVPIAGDVVDTFFPGQLLAAGALQKHIESTHWVEDSEANAKASGDHARHLETVQADKKLRRIVYLHD